MKKFSEWMNDQNKRLENCSREELYYGLLSYVKEYVAEIPEKKDKKKLYYISAEFLIGKLLSNNLINLHLYEEIRMELEAAGKSMTEIEEVEPEPSLGNGGLGRLAACFLDSIAALNLNGDGVGLNYHFGLFHQVFHQYKQCEEPNPWMEEESWLTKTETVYPVSFGGLTVSARMYDIDIPGYHGGKNKLHLFDIESIDESIVKEWISFDKKAVEKNLTLFLYPDDSDADGRLLRVYQQYFMVCSGAQLILAEAKAKGSNLHDLYDYAAIQINDTHPTMIIPELIRLLEQEGIEEGEAIEIVTKTCAYTNHTILAEALEKWPVEYLEKAVPQLMPIIRRLDKIIREKYSSEKLQIIDKKDLVHMAHMDIHFGHSVNGVAKLHTEILEESELHPFYEIYPEKFNNKTNGITFRRWLLHCNHPLTELIKETIGPEFENNEMELEKMGAFEEDESVLKKLLNVKKEGKRALKEWLYKTQGITVDENSIFDIQIKRLHEYKRQQMNVLYLIDKYLRIKAGERPSMPVTVIFGAKAAPAYTIAKDIIHLILCMQELIDSDPEVCPYLKVVMVENYNVTAAEKLIPACDISEQISLASKEASGTGNMKFMLNGAVTLGTEDGANVEIHQLVGDKNIYIFGDDSETVIKRYEKGSYDPKDYYKNDARIKAAVDFLADEKLLAIGDKTALMRLQSELLTKDWFMTFPDFEAYIETRETAYRDYENSMEWAKKMLKNISKAGYFSSDRTIREYNRDIWKLS